MESLLLGHLSSLLSGTGFLLLDLLYPVTLDDLHAVEGSGYLSFSSCC